MVFVIIVGTVTFHVTNSGTIMGVTTVAVMVARTIAVLRDTNVRVRSWNETTVSVSVLVDIVVVSVTIWEGGGLQRYVTVLE